MIRATAMSAAAMVLLAACGSDLAPREIATLDGAWEGDYRRDQGDERQCPARIRFQLMIQGGSVAGEAYDVRAPAVKASFESFVETDGQMFLDARIAGDVMHLSGRFRTGGFGGTDFRGEGRSERRCRGPFELTRARGR